MNLTLFCLLYVSLMKSRHDIRNRVRQHRLAKELTQQQLADHIGVTRQTILFIEKGQFTPSVALALQLGEILEASVETLFRLNKGGSDE